MNWNAVNSINSLSGPWSLQWNDAIALELNQLAERGVLVPAPPDFHGRALKSKMLLRVTFDNNYAVKFKARFVVCGYSQRPGIDFHETFSPTTSSHTIMMLIHCAGALQMHMSGFDVGAAFLEGMNDVPLFCQFPRELTPVNQFPIFFQIIRSLYGEKQAPKLWNDHLHSILIHLGLRRSPMDPCLYAGTINGDCSTQILLCVHVDDGLLLTKPPGAHKLFLESFAKHLQKITRFDPIQKYVGLELSPITDTIQCGWTIHQESYISAHFTTRENTFHPRVPMSPSIDLRTQTPIPENASLLPVIGALRYLADRSRPDILVATAEMSCGTAHTAPSIAHLNTATQCVDYLQHTKHLRLKLGSDHSLLLFAFCDASYISVADSKSRLGGCLFLGINSGAFQSFSKKDTTVSHSSTEAEIKALDILIKEVDIARIQLEFMGLPMLEPTKIFMDNASAILLCNSLRSGHKTKHINVRINYIRQVINDRIVELHFVPSAFNVADILTKPLGPDLFLAHRTHLLSGFSEHEFQTLLTRGTSSFQSHS